jgi:hypothetical protein
MLFLTTELRELGGGPGDPDILVFAPESLTWRAMRGAGVSCALGRDLILVDAATMAGYRAAQAGRDSILLHQESSLATAADDRWLHLPLHGVAGATCGGAPALAFATTLDTTIHPPASFASLAPLRTFEVMQVRLYQSGGDYWLGARSVSAGETIQPLAGPLTAGGLSFSYQDSAGAPAAAAEAIRSIGISLRAVSSVPVRLGGSGLPIRRTDSLATSVTLRNW